MARSDQPSAKDSKTTAEEGGKDSKASASPSAEEGGKTDEPGDESNETAALRPDAERDPAPADANEFASSGSLEAARAEEQEQAAKAAFRRGDRQYLEGNYEGAVRSFEEAYALCGRIEMLFNLANAHERLDNYSEASLALRGYIPHAPASNRDALEKRLARLEDLAREARTKSSRPAAPVVLRTEPENRSPVRLSTSVGIGLLTLSGAGLITGTAFAISAANSRAKLKDECEDGETGRLCPPDSESLIDRDEAHSLVADVAFISSAALGATGLYLVLHKSKKKGNEVRASFSPGSLQVGGSF